MRNHDSMERALFYAVKYTFFAVVNVLMAVVHLGGKPKERTSR